MLGPGYITVSPSLAQRCQNHCLEAGQMKRVLREPVGEDWAGTRGEQLLDFFGQAAAAGEHSLVMSQWGLTRWWPGPDLHRA